MEKEIVDLKKKIEELESKYQEQRDKFKNHKIKYLNGQIRILEGALKMVDKNEGKIFHNTGKLNASQLATLVDHSRADSGLEDMKPKYDTIKKYIEIALRPPTEINNNYVEYE